jgi:hypothetical protein
MADAPGQTTGVGTTQGSGNSALAGAFNEAIQEANKTLQISVVGQANLNALRARPQ